MTRYYERGDDPDDTRRPTRIEAEEDARLDAADRKRDERHIAEVIDSIDFADRYDLLSVICPTPWYPHHDGHETTCVPRVNSLIPAIARIVYRHTR